MKEGENSRGLVIPRSSPVFHSLDRATRFAKVIVVAGLPGTGKSLYLTQLMRIARANNRKVSCFQWDVARKSFETPVLSKKFPMGEGIVHPGVKLAAGFWLMAFLEEWLTNHADQNSILLIEAPLVGNRFIEIMRKNKNPDLEGFLSSNRFQVMIPIPSIEIRNKIERARAQLVSEDAKTWMGAKPSVVKMLWKHTCEIANEFGRNISLSAQPPYDPEIYNFVYSVILKHRHFTPLHIDEEFPVNIKSEDDLHISTSLKPSEEEAIQFASLTSELYPSENALLKATEKWYIT